MVQKLFSVRLATEGFSNMRAKRIATNLLISILLACFVAFSIAALTGYSQKRTVTQFLADFVGVQVGESAEEVGRHLTLKYSGAVHTEETYLGTNSHGDCRNEKCNFAFLFENSLLRKLKLSPPVWVRANIVAEHNLIIYKHLEMGCGEGPTYFLASVTETPTSNGQAFYVNHRRSDNTDWRTTVQLTPAASRNQHESAYAINVDRFISFHRCKSANDLIALP